MTLSRRGVLGLAGAMGAAGAVAGAAPAARAAAPGAEGTAAAPAPERVLTGCERLAADGYAELAGQRVGVVTNPTGITADARHLVDVLHADPRVDLVAAVGGAHGMAGFGDWGAAGGAGGAARGWGRYAGPPAAADTPRAGQRR
ncbi:exo-beta-N-acetylmuramidase NamZ domain-containing protein, partial [Streptomyces lavendulae]|uniref:exo-beta-N-acetylmuramidase NamZ domain-containing protein n=1 Tax=Streptomyces lavendulae TaxID=1914 RepID=UPI0036A9474D